MGLKTDFMSLGAIGLGTAVAVVGTGGLLVAGAIHGFANDVAADVEESGRCMTVSIAKVARATAPRAPSEAPVTVVEIVDGDVNVDVSELHQLGEAPLDVDVRVDCVTRIEREMDAHVRVLSEESAHLEAELREMAEELRADAREMAREAAGASGR